MSVRRILPVLLLTAGLLLPAKSASADDVESQVFAMINAGRGTPLVLHHGLLSDAEGHSQYMAQTGNLNHDDAQQRVEEAPPDPPEANGAPDDGFNLYGWCENATYVTPAQGDPATAIYNNWKNSPPHNACMNNTGKNVGAVGVYWDGSTYWATFVAESDSTPPGGAPAHKTSGPTTQDVTNPSNPTNVKPEQPHGVYVPSQTLAPVTTTTNSTTHYDSTPVNAAPVQTTAPSPTPAPQPSVVTAPRTDLLVPSSQNADTSAHQPGFGLPELAAVLACLVLGCLVLERRMRVPSEFTIPDEPLPHEELALSTTTS
jgi:hypothetical protein